MKKQSIDKKIQLDMGKTECELAMIWVANEFPFDEICHEKDLEKIKDNFLFEVGPRVFDDGKAVEFLRGCLVLNKNSTVAVNSMVLKQNGCQCVVVGATTEEAKVAIENALKIVLGVSAAKKLLRSILLKRYRTRTVQKLDFDMRRLVHKKYYEFVRKVLGSQETIFEDGGFIDLHHSDTVEALKEGCKVEFHPHSLAGNLVLTSKVEGDSNSESALYMRFDLDFMTYEDSLNRMYTISSSLSFPMHLEAINKLNELWRKPTLDEQAKH